MEQNIEENGILQETGTFCILKQNTVVFSNKHVAPLLKNLITGFTNLGKRLFEEELSRIETESLVIAIFPSNGQILVCIDETNDKVNELCIKYQDYFTHKVAINQA
ncbi:hypothetical protein GINT2_001715 [Glugoides intestinalis]